MVIENFGGISNCENIDGESSFILSDENFTFKDGCISLCCPICFRETPSFDLHFCHLRVEHRKFVCTVCLKLFNSRRSLGFHHNVTHGDKDHLKCHLCFKKFAHVQNKNAHLRNVHGVLRPRDVPCIRLISEHKSENHHMQN